MKESCGVFGIYGHRDASRLTYLGLFSLQHRGQESAGIACTNGREMNIAKGMGLVSEVFRERRFLHLKGRSACGHVRYSTTGSSSLKNAQPFMVDTGKGRVAIAHNGNLVNTMELRDRLEREGAIFQTTSDSEVIVHLMARDRKRDLRESLVNALKKIKGAYSLVILTQDALIGCRDPQGIRPLSLGRLGNAYILSSETCGMDIIQARYLREVEPGEVVYIDRNGLTSVHISSNKEKKAYCIFEFIYFSRPDSNIFGKNVASVREALGRELFKEHPAEVDIVVPVPDSGNYAALGYAQEGRLPFEIGIVRNHYIGRTFIEPIQSVRDLGVRIKLNPVKNIVRGKRIALIEDSIVRGTTSQGRIRALREAGAKEIHMRISCPPHCFPCFFGIDFPTREELIAYSKNEEEIGRFIGVDSLRYLSLEGMLRAMPLPGKDFCTACFSGRYPIRIKEKIRKSQLEEKK